MILKQMRHAWNKFKKEINWTFIYIMLTITFIASLVFHVLFSEDEWWSHVLIYMIVVCTAIVIPLISIFFKFCRQPDNTRHHNKSNNTKEVKGVVLMHIGVFVNIGILDQGIYEIGIPSIRESPIDEDKFLDAAMMMCGGHNSVAFQNFENNYKLCEWIECTLIIKTQ